MYERRENSSENSGYEREGIGYTRSGILDHLLITWVWDNLVHLDQQFEISNSGFKRPIK